MSPHFKLPADARSGPNCGVTALAVAAGVSFARAWNTFATVGNYGRRWKGATFTHHQGPALDKLGIKWHSTVPAGGGNWFAGKGKTVKYFVENHTRPDTLYMITTGSHVQLALNGMMLDQCGPKPVDEYRFERCIVKRVLVIETPFKHAPVEMTIKPMPEIAKAARRTADAWQGSTLFPHLFKEQTPPQNNHQIALF
jgi:hypothetical protein